MKKLLILSLLLSLFLVTGCDEKNARPLLQSAKHKIDQTQNSTDKQGAVKIVDSNKQESSENYDKIPDHLISADQIIQMEMLMNKNGESLSGLQAYRFEKDQLGMTHIRFYFYVNGVRANETIYHFKADNTLSSVTNRPDTGTYTKIPTVPKISKDQAISIASNKIAASTPEIVKDLELNATKEFWNKNTSNTTSNDIILAWRVSGVNSYPVVIIDAQTGEVIHYDNGIRY